MLAAMAAVALWLTPTPQAQEPTASCGISPLHGRTQKVVEAILEQLPTSNCREVTSAQLAEITTVDASRRTLMSLQSGDFAGLSGLQSLSLHVNSLRTLPADVFDGLSSLRTLNIWQNSLRTLPADVFDGLSSLIALHLSENLLAALPADVFDGLSSLESLDLSQNSLTALRPDAFAGLSSLQELRLDSNGSLACIHASQFDGLSELTLLHLQGSQVGNIAPDYFTQWQLANLQEMKLGAEAISLSSIDFAVYQAVLPALIESVTSVHEGGLLAHPICGSIEADEDAGGFHQTVRVQLEKDFVRPNRARASDATLLGDDFCGSDGSAARHSLWTWQRSDDQVSWADMDDNRQPKDYGVRAAGECSFIYRPRADDNGAYIRALVPVNTAGVGEKNYTSAVFGPLVVQQP